MGAQSTKSENTVGHLNSEECSRLKKLFNTFHGGGKNEKASSCTYSDFQTHCERFLDDWLARRITDKLSVRNPKNEELHVPLSHYLNFVSNLLKGTIEEKVDLIWNLAIEESPEKRDTVTTEEILQYTRSIFESYLKCMENTALSKSWEGCERLTCDSVSDFAENLLIDLFYDRIEPKEIIAKRPERNDYTQDELTKCLSKSAMILNMHNSVLSQCFDFDKVTYFTDFIPHCLKPKSVLNTQEFTILDLSRIVFLNSQLPSEFRKEWRYLFSTSTHGESFTKLLSETQEKGATILVVRDQTGRIFGGFSSQSWTLGPQFFGDHKSFLFHLSPKFAAYTSTGYNDSFQYLNVQQQTMPNGMGMGGKLGYFGLWIDAEFGKGKCSPTCTTFSSPQLTTAEDFNIHHLEVWGVGPAPTKDENERDLKSCLDKNPEAKVMLDLLDKRQVSEGYREVPKDQIDSKH